MSISCKPSKEEDAWALFCKKAFRGKCWSICPKELVDVTILKKCGGTSTCNCSNRKSIVGEEKTFCRIEERL